ncbi:MAG: DUF1501 domain-containing protein [Planctomycetes bacterium]|nr:DUF1501 domain-containing protein [Planctomycetota bacterium]
MSHRGGLDRRSLLTAGLGLGGLALLGGRAQARVRLAGPFGRGAEERAGRVLVLVQLTGGNDGLSTVVPHGDDAYGRARTATRIAANEVLRIDDYRGLHPALKGLKRHYDAGRLAIIEGCGYPEPIRSHFRSYEVWHTANAKGRASGQGWVGRLADAAFGVEETPELVVHVGGTAPYSVYSLSHPPVIFNTPQSYRWIGPETEDLAAYRQAAEADSLRLEDERRKRSKKKQTGSEAAIERLRGVLADANESSARIRRAAVAYTPRAEYPADELGESLRIVASLVDARIGTRVVSVELGGFDSHDNQRAQHDGRMRVLDGALSAFLDDLQGRSVADDVLVVVFSEFGRRVQENGSRGTDHGTAGPMLVLGNRVKGGLHGKHPSLTELDRGDLVHTTDFRGVYAAAIERWFGADSARVLGGRFAPIRVV